MVHQFLIGSMRNFIYLVVDQTSNVAMVVDPQSDCSPWESVLEAKGTKLIGILLTHTHHDHIAGVQKVSEKYSVPIFVHADDAHRIEKKYSADILRLIRKFNDGEKIAMGSQSIEAIHSPGHSAGEVCFLLKSTKPWSLLTGDTIFVGNVGRTDFEDGSDEEMFKTIQKIKCLPHDSIIYPGHDYGKTTTTTIGRECEENACFQAKNVDELKALP